MQRLLVGKPGTLTATLLDTNGNPVAPTGSVTVGVVSASGATIVTPGTSATVVGGESTGVVTVAVTATQAGKLDLWTSTWTDAAGATQSADHEVCGGFLFSVADARASDSSLKEWSKFPDALVMACRQAVEEECERICDVAFVPRYRIVTLDGTAKPEILLPDPAIRKIRSVTIIVNTGSTITFTDAQLAYIVIDDDFQIQRNDGGIWDEGRRNVTIEYECGQNAPPAELASAALLRLRTQLTRNKSAVPDRATSFTTDGGMTFRLDTAGPWSTGIPDVDAVYGRYSMRDYDPDHMVPASRQMDMDTQWYSVYHGGRR